MGPRSCERGNSKNFVARQRIYFGFNGAALVRARKSPGEQIPRARLTALQWGRARASAEMPSFGFSLSHHPMLQWGRARASAEIRCGFPSRHAHFNGFNGAALVRARKWPGCKQLGLRRRNNRFRAAAIFNLLTNWACRFLFILLCVLRPCLQRCERLAVVRCHVAARTLAHG